MKPNTGLNPFKGDLNERTASVMVKLRNERLCGPWLAHTTRWSLRDDPFDVVEWEKA